MSYYVDLLRYLFQSKHRRGYGVHSPSVFRLITLVIEERLPYYSYFLIEKIRYLSNRKGVDVFLSEEGELFEKNKVCLAKWGQLGIAYDQILFRLVNYYKPKTIVELGTTMGFSTLYLATPNSQAHVITLSEKKEISDFAKNNFKKSSVCNILLKEGDIESNFRKLIQEQVQFDFLSINCTMLPRGFYSYCNTLLQKGSFGGVIVINEPYFWESNRDDLKKIKLHDQVRVVIDLFHIVILILDSNLQKEEFVLRYY